MYIRDYEEEFYQKPLRKDRGTENYMLEKNEGTGDRAQMNESRR